MIEYPKIIETVGIDLVSGRIVRLVTRVESPGEEAFVRSIDKECVEKAVEKQAAELRRM